MDFNYNHLYYFYIAAKSGGITIASEQLHISQPSLSSQLKVLEEFFDIKLFEKVGRRNRLTESGLVIYEYCKNMFELADKMNSVVVSKAPSAKMKINVGISNEVDKEFIGEIIGNFLGEFPVDRRPQVNLSSGTSSQLLDHLHFKEIDMIISTEVITEDEFIDLAQIRGPIVLCCSNKWQNLKILTSDRRWDNDSIVDFLLKRNDINWVLPSVNLSLRTLVDKFFEDKHLSEKVVFESDSISALVRSVRNDLGFSFIPLLHVANEIKSEHICRLGPAGGFWDYKLTLGCLSRNQDDELVKKFANSFRKYSDQLIVNEIELKSFMEPVQVNV